MDRKKRHDRVVSSITGLDTYGLLYLKNRVYKTKLQNLNDLRRRIFDEVALIANKHIEDAVSSFYHRIVHQTVNNLMNNLSI